MSNLPPSSWPLLGLLFSCASFSLPPFSLSLSVFLYTLLRSSARILFLFDSLVLSCSFLLSQGFPRYRFLVQHVLTPRWPEVLTRRNSVSRAFRRTMANNCRQSAYMKTLGERERSTGAKRVEKGGKRGSERTGHCENEVCETGTNLAGIVIASLKRRAWIKEGGAGKRGKRVNYWPISDFELTFQM